MKEKLKKGHMGASPIISVIVPMYLAEDWLDRCIESILAQPVEGVELILIDDASPDSCGEIAASWAQRDGRVRTLTADGAGAGPARNVGIAAAKGKYVAFVDADDWIDADHFERLLSAAEEHGADIALTGLAEMHGGQVIRLWESPLAGRVLKSPDERFEYRKSLFGTLPEQLKKGSTPVGITGALIRHDFLCSEEVLFPAGYGEDIRFNICALRCARTVVVVPGHSYRYNRDNGNSTTVRVWPEHYEEVFAFLAELCRMADEEGPQYREESRLRADRAVIDQARRLLSAVQEQPLHVAEKRTLAEKILRDPLLAEVCVRYPSRRLPLVHRVYLRLLKARSVTGVLAAGKIRKLLLG